MNSHARTIVGANLSMALVLASLLVPGAVVAQAEEPTDGPVTVYSGRSESLVAPLFERFTAATGIEVQARYADTAELAALLLEEGDRSPADLFFSQDAGALGVVAQAGLFSELDPTVLERVDTRFQDPNGHWVGVSGRARTAAYSTTTDLALPDSILDFTDPEWSGRLGWAPANGSFQAFVTALRELEGEEVAREWLEGIMANDAIAYPKNTAAVEGVAAGEVDVVFVNHYYLLRLLEENGPDYPVAQAFFDGGDVGALINVAGVGRLSTTDSPAATDALIDFMLDAEAQRYFSTQTFEFPLAAQVEADPRLPELSGIESPDLHLSQLADLPGTVALLREVGAID